MATATAMDALEIGEFLGSQATGVLALVKGDSLYAIPLSFAFSEEESDIYFRFGFGRDSQKRSYVKDADEATFVVYDRTEDGWKSVIAEGHLEEVSVSNLDSSVAEAVHQLRIPFFEVHRQPADKLEFHISRLDVDKLSGVSEAKHSRESVIEEM